MSEHTPSIQPIDPLETELIALGRALVVQPPAADLAVRVLELIKADAQAAGRTPLGTAPPAGLRVRTPGLSARATTGRPAWLPASRGLSRRAGAAALPMLLLCVLVPPVRAAVLDLLRIGGVTVREIPTPTPATTSERPANPAPGSPDAALVGSLAEAAERVGFDVATPTALGAPTTIVVTREARVVELSWGDGPGGTRMDIFAGSPSSGYLKRVWAAVTPTEVAGREAVWFASPHLIEWIDRAGVSVASAPRVAGPTLVWVERDQAGREITYRLEGPGTLEAARAIAESVPRRPAG